MIKATIPVEEAQRLQALVRLEILDSGSEPLFDAITRLAARLYKTDISTISLIDANRQWFKACVGLNTRETAREPAFCGYAITQKDVMIVHDALDDQRFWDNPFVTGPPFIRFYAGAPLVTSDGYAVGTLCVIDREPRAPGSIDRHALKELAGITIGLIEKRLENRLLAERLRRANVNAAALG
ncbi:MAG TPA: GAF domain-containing protein [Bryobacteraceae bacterium]|jgi:GAF domain-containing protein|nr:GAF domain-containing protein [Bryobacteraceae bacterium]